MKTINILLVISLALFLGFACNPQKQPSQVQTKKNQEESTIVKKAETKVATVKKEDKGSNEVSEMMDYGAMRGSQLMGMFSQGMYNPRTIQTIKGEVLAVEKSGPMMYGLKIKANNQTIYVHLGPVWYIEEQKINFQVKDKVEVKGSKNTLWKEPVIIAAEIRKANQTLRLFNKDGFPVWMDEMHGQGMMMDFSKGKGQGWMWGAGMMRNFYHNMYDPKSVATIKGEVLDIENSGPMMSGLKLKTEKATVYVHLGPTWYIENQKLQFKKKDQLEIKGSKMSFGKDYVIVASEIKKGSQILRLYNKNAYPVWMDEMYGQGMMMGDDKINEDSDHMMREQDMPGNMMDNSNEMHN